MTQPPKLFHRDSFINRGDKAHWEIAQEEFEKWYIENAVNSGLEKLLKAVDTAVWAWAVKKNSKRRGQVNWKNAIDEMSEAYECFYGFPQQVAVLSEKEEKC